MKLINRFIFIYLIVTAIVLGVGGVISYFIIKNEIDSELERQFSERVDRATYLIDRDRRFNPNRDEVDGDQNMVIRKLDDEVRPSIAFTDTLVWNEGLERMEKNRKVIAYRRIDGRYYKISTFGLMIDSDDITEAVVKILLWLLGLQVIGAIGIGLFVPGHLFRPFQETLSRIRGFKLQKREPIPAQRTQIREFNDLNLFVEEMTRKAISDYRNLKEFAENASHELRTPLAIAKGKLELLTETDLDTEQYRYVESLQRTVKKLSRLSESLGLLTKIENHEFSNGECVNLTRLIREGIEVFQEFIHMNHLEVQSDLQEDVIVNMHPALAEILWTNLFQNSIQHNLPNGKIHIDLTSLTLRISNTGKPFYGDPEVLFERFKKSDQSDDSIGLGLSIVQRIVKESGFCLTYKNSDEWHTIEIWLKKSLTD
ncbi:MAG: HAMP domain-containing sensor histidine kinase [Balneolaceae bacterium]